MTFPMKLSFRSLSLRCTHLPLCSLPLEIMYEPITSNRFLIYCCIALCVFCSDIYPHSILPHIAVSGLRDEKDLLREMGEAACRGGAGHPKVLFQTRSLFHAPSFKHRWRFVNIAIRIYDVKMNCCNSQVPAINRQGTTCPERPPSIYHPPQPWTHKATDLDHSRP